MILPKIRDPRFITVRRGGTLRDDDHRLLAIWAAECAEHVLHHFERARPKDDRPRRAIDLARAWARGEISWQEARTAAGHANAAARDLRGAPRHAAYAAGQAAAVGHVAAHELGAAAYAIRAARAAAPEDEGEAAGSAECRWQRARLPGEIRDLVLDDQQSRNELCWFVFDPPPVMNRAARRTRSLRRGIAGPHSGRATVPEGEMPDVSDTMTTMYTAGDPGSGTPGVIVFHPWWGLNDDVVAYADRLAAEGLTVVAPDMFGGEVASTIEEAERLAGAAAEEAIDAIALAALDLLVDRLAPTSTVAALGFSFGAHWAMWSPTERDRVVASVLYYGTTGGPVLAATSVPVLGHFAETDPFESDEWVTEFEGELRAAGRVVEIHRYPGTGHWFAEPSRDAWRPEAADLAFERTVAFLRRQLGAPKAS